MNRAEAPAFRPVEHIELIQARSHKLDNGLEIFVVNAGEQDLIRLEFVFKNIAWDPSKPLQAYAVNSMLIDGTSEFKAAQIAERIDYYGAFMQAEYHYDYSSIIIHTLNKHLAKILPIVKSVLTDAIFPAGELDTFKRNQKQKLNISLGKNDVLSRRTFNHALFADTLYGYLISAEDYDNIIREELVEYFNHAYQPANCSVLVAGKVTDGVIDLLNSYFGVSWGAGTSVSENEFKFSPGNGSEHYIEKPDSLQSAIRLGQITVNRSHPDFPGLQVLNTILGGYFGSRLMANIREDKGYTYGIGSAIVSFKNSGCMFIASEVGVDVCSAAITEIEKEINLLKSEPVSKQELELVQNYMMGSLLGSLENAFSHADKFKNIHFLGLGYDYYDTYINTVKTITEQEILVLANKYLDFDKFEKVIVGKR